MNGINSARALHAAQADRVGHSSIQPWSAGDIFPAIIARVERYASYASAEQFYAGDDAGKYAGQYEARRDRFYAHPLADRLESTSWELTLNGHSEEFASYDDAYSVGLAMKHNAQLRADWGGTCAEVRPHDAAGVS